MTTTIKKEHAFFPQMPQQITVKDALEKYRKGAIFIDTRTPKEFVDDHLPDAINVPILNNEERVIVGTLYKQVSQEKAIEVGMDFYKKNVPSILKAVEPYKEKTLIVHCWRGGLRSKTIAALLESLHCNVYQLQGGYKAYRAYIVERLATYHIKPKVIVLYGLTCSGKTALLKHFKNVIDLEELAGHRGSMYGSIGITQKTQKSFDNNLLQQLEKLQNETYMLVEGESKRVGDVFIPDFFFAAMQNGIKIKIERSMQKRAEAAVSEYLNTEEKVAEFREITTMIRKNMAAKTKQEILSLLDQKHYEQAAELLFAEYYDPMYEYTLKSLQFVAVIDNDDPKKAVGELRCAIENISQVI